MPSNSLDPPAAETLTPDFEFDRHLRALGLGSADEYLIWCARHGFGTRIEKHWRERCRERYLASQDLVKARLTRKKQEKRRPRQIIEAICCGEVDEAKLTRPELILLYQTVSSIEDPATKRAFRQLLVCIQSQTGLLTTKPACHQFGNQVGNTFIEGLAALARNHTDWILPPKTWRPRSHNVRRQFSSLARHLTAKYPVPLFMDSVWFRGQTVETERQQKWFRRLGSGASPRSLDLPIPLTKGMARHFLQSPQDYSVDAALRRSQILGLGGNGRLVKAILGSRIAAEFEHDHFWQAVIRWFIQNPMLDPSMVSPLIDYIDQLAFERHNGDGAAVPLKGENGSGFRMKGRTPASLIRQMREWHSRLRKEPEKPKLEWSASGIGAFDWTEGTLALGHLRRWTIMELLSRKELYNEGRVMRHCVSSYDNSCALGGTSIWSMGVERDCARRKRVLTIELATASKRICQVRGKANRLATQKEMAVLRRWASQQNLTFAECVRV